MNTKNIALALALCALMTTETCHGMSYIRNWYNSLYTSINNHMPSKPEWFTAFMNRYRTVGIMGMFYAKTGIHDFKSMTGLTKGDNLELYSLIELEDAINRVKAIINYGGWSQKLQDLLTRLEGQHFQTSVNEEAKSNGLDPNPLNYDEQEALKNIQELSKTKNK